MNGNNPNAPITRKILKETLGEFTEEVLLPSVEKIVDQIVDQKVGSSTHELKNYVDKKIGGLRGDLVLIMKTGKERDHQFKRKMVDIVERNQLAPIDEIAVLNELV